MEHERSASPDIDELLGSLPACRRCRSNRRRCDTQLPSCRNCSKAGAECIFFDHVTERDISRSYVLGLIQRLQNTQKKCSEPYECNDNFSVSPSSLIYSEVEIRPHTDRYIGILSCLAPAFSNVRNTETEASQAPTPPYVPFQGDLTPDQETFEYLVLKYLSDIQNIYPLLHETLPFLSPEWLVENNEPNLTHMQRFMLEMVYSVASHRVLDESPNHEGMSYYQMLADASHRRGLMIFDKAATDISMHTLETVTLAALHSLLSPQTGNIGQLIGLAARLAIDLGAVDKPNNNSKEGSKIDQIYKSIYCLENQYATALDRPGLLPQPVIDPESRIPQDVLCAAYRIQACFRSQRGNVDATSLVQELDGYVSIIEQMPIQSRHNVTAAVYETRLLIQSDDEQSAICLLEIYSQKFYIRTALSPSWAYRAGLVVVSKISTHQSHPGTIQNHNLHKSYQAYVNCLLFLGQCSRRWPSANALRVSLQEAASRP